MRKVQVRDLVAGARYSLPIFMDDENLFVAEGLPIKERDIQRLKRWGITEVYTDGERISDDPKRSFNAFFLRPFQTPRQKRLTDEYGLLRTEVLSLFGTIRSSGNVDRAVVNSVVERLVRLVNEDADDLIQYMLYGMQGETGDVENALNVAAISALIGKRLQLLPHRVTTLSMGALLHDVGMLRIRRDIVAKKGGLTSDERRVVQTHPVLSYRIITKELGFDDEVGSIALQHHERWDGGGYPRKLMGNGITVESRIVAIADAFVAMISNKPHRSSMIGYNAVRNLLRDNGTQFDPQALKVFVQVVGIYPIGSVVVLSSGAVCRVTENDPSSPLKPVVKVLIDEVGHEYVDDNGAELDLTTGKHGFITKAIDAKTLGGGQGSAT